MNYPAQILIVDDESHVRAFFSRLAQSHLGAPKIFEAADGESALELYRRERPDLVLLDLNLIGMSGLEVLDQLRAIDEDAVVIVLSTMSVLSVIQEVVARGANGYVLKNIGSEKVQESLVAAVADVFGDSEESD
jgi:two-component system chemotaxis response regulator CheY